jgi:hypothetical protein
MNLHAKFTIQVKPIESTLSKEQNLHKGARQGSGLQSQAAGARGSRNRWFPGQIHGIPGEIHEIVRTAADSREKNAISK